MCKIANSPYLPAGVGSQVNPHLSNTLITTKGLREFGDKSQVSCDC